MAQETIFIIKKKMEKERARTIIILEKEFVSYWPETEPYKSGFNAGIKKAIEILKTEK